MASGSDNPFAGYSADGRPTSQPRAHVEEAIAKLASTVQGMWQYRWLALATAWAVCLAGWGFVFTLPDIYEANTRIYVDTDSMVNRVVGDLTVGGDVMTEINVLTRAMLSQPQLEKTARLTGLDLEATNQEQFARMLEGLRQRIQISREAGEISRPGSGGPRGTTPGAIFNITYTDSDRATAERVIRTLLDTFVEDALGERRTDSGAAEQFLEEQIEEYQERLSEAELRLADFKRENVGRMPGETGDYYTRLQAAMNVAEETRAELRLALERRAEYERQIDGEEPVFGLVTPTATTGVPVGANTATIAKLEDELQTLLLRYTENHPDAVALQERIDRLREQDSAAPVAVAPTTPRIGLPQTDDPLEINTVYQRMRMGLSETEVEVATLRSRLAAEDAAVEELKTLVDTIPDIERQLTALNRDYDVTRSQYETLLERRESLYITGEVEQSRDQLQFRVIDPPQVSLGPVGPNRPFFLIMTTAAAVGGAIALAFLLLQLNPVFNSQKELRSACNLPVLGTISLAQSAADRALSRKQAMMYAAACVAIPVALALVVSLHEQARALLLVVA